MEVEKIQVKEIMRKRVITVKESTTLRELIEIFDKYTFHTLPVVDKENKVVGIVAFEDILKVFEPHPSYIMDMLRRTPLWEEYGIKDFLEIDIPPEIGILCVAEDLMNTNVITTTEEATIIEVCSLMKLNKLRRIPVVDKERRLVGIVSLFDIILAIFKE
ncbi:CBS domain-containing protein, partial [Candidatus Aerophobetes bacterium]|nr:CBS domain-containing protein [Candidatus Aerophobetes bacterium]